MRERIAFHEPQGPPDQPREREQQVEAAEPCVREPALQPTQPADKLEQRHRQ